MDILNLKYISHLYIRRSGVYTFNETQDGNELFIPTIGTGIHSSNAFTVIFNVSRKRLLTLRDKNFVNTRLKCKTRKDAHKKSCAINNALQVHYEKNRIPIELPLTFSLSYDNVR